MNLQRFKEKRGITLIALVVTIIVLLILAGISISMLTGQNSTLNRAREAKEEYSNSTEKEQIQLSYNSAITRKLGESITAEELQNELNEVVGKNEDGTSKTETTDIGNRVFYVKFVKTNHNYRVDNGDVTLLTGEDKSVVEPKNVADWKYEPNDDGTLTITGYKGSDTEVVIPNHIGGVAVKRIYGLEKLTDIYHYLGKGSIWEDNIREKDDTVGYGNGLGENAIYLQGSFHTTIQKTIKRITISYGIEEIGEYAFLGTVNLESVSIPSSVTSIGYSTFRSCSSLTNITIPSNVTSIENETFSECSSLKNIEIPSSVTGIGSNAFDGCSSLTNIVIPSSVIEIGSDVFSECSSLTNIVIPSSVTAIGSGMFYDCNSLTNVTIPSGVTEIGDWAFSGCSNLKDITIPSSVTTIYQRAFEDCRSLTNITIPSKVTSMGSGVFYGIPSITVTVPYKLGENPPSDWDSDWNETSSDCEVKIKYQE